MSCKQGTTQNWEFTVYAKVEILDFDDEDESNNNGSVHMFDCI